IGNHFLPPVAGLGDTIFVLADPLLAINLQMQWLKENETPAPIVGTFRDATHRTSCWSSLPARERVFWAEQIDEDLLLQAREADGRVSLLKGAAQVIRN